MIIMQSNSYHEVGLFLLYTQDYSSEHQLKVYQSIPRTSACSPRTSKIA